ncbi:MAG: sodium/proline symporter [Acidobacteriota bacterium]|nr:MAG: sodium/proline symporter [Acidobacteriota bacterium]
MNIYEKLTNPLALGIFLLSLLLPVIVGVLALRRTRSQSDFFVGGRAMGRLVVALSAVSSGRSSWLVLGVSGMAYSRGSGAVWAILGYTAVEFLQFFYVGRRLRTETQALGSITLLDYFESRFHDEKHLIRIVGALIIGVFLTAYVAAQLTAGARTLVSALGLPLWASLLFAAGLIVVYMVLGGYIAVAYNDVVRAVIMLIGLLVLPAVGLVAAGGVGVVRQLLVGIDPSLVDPVSIGIGAIIGFLGIGLGSPGQPHILVRYMSIDDPRHLRSAAVIGTIWNILLGLGAVMIGLVGRAVVSDPSGLPDGDAEMVYLVLSARYFGPALYGLLVGGIFAAILSTADSQLLVVASTFVRDVYEKIIRERASIDEARKLAFSRMIVVVSGFAALALAYFASDLVFWLVLFAWGGLGASVGPALIFALYGPRATRAGIVAGMLTGTLVTIVWKLWLTQPTGLYELVPAFVSSTAAVFVVSLLSKPSQPGSFMSPSA